MHKYALSALFALYLGQSQATAIISVAEDDKLGLYPAKQFMLPQANTETGACATCRAVPQALWYFKQEAIVTPTPQAPIAGFSTTQAAMQDLATTKQLNDLPALVWVGSPSVLNAATMNTEAHTLSSPSGESWPFEITPKIPTNLSYWDASTAQFFNGKTVRVRGELKDGKMIARTIWPKDFSLNLNAKLQPLAAGESLKSLVQAEHGGAQLPYESRLLWEKSPSAAQQSAGKAAMAFMLNGAQGDDDEAHGGHFAVATGRVEADGDYSRWLVNNYYNLANNSEKGIIAAVTPMDKYLADLNNGQSYYRPSYMLVAVFKTDRVPSQFEASTNRIYNHFYRNDFIYDHSRDNCAGISIDTLRALGWNVPTRGVESQLKATAAYFYVAASEMSLKKGRAIYDYLNTEITRLFPATAFDAIGQDLFDRLLNPAHKMLKNGVLETQISGDIEALYFVRIPQIPSSRAFGQAPVYRFDQYMQQAPADRSQWKIVPVTPNPLPEQMKDGQALQRETPSLVPWPVLVLTLLLVASLVWMMKRIKRWLKRR